MIPYEWKVGVINIIKSIVKLEKNCFDERNYNKLKLAQNNIREIFAYFFCENEYFENCANIRECA